MDETALLPIFEEMGEILELAIIRDRATQMHKGKSRRLLSCLTLPHLLTAAQAVLSLRTLVRQLPRQQLPSFMTRSLFLQ